MEKIENIIRKKANKDELNSLKINDSFIFEKVNSIFDKFEEIIKESELFPLSETEYVYNSQILSKINNNIYISYKLNDEFSDNGCIITDIIFFYIKRDISSESPSPIEEINLILEGLKKGIFMTDDFEDNKSISNLSYLSIDQNGFYLTDLNIDTSIDYNLCYNKNTLKELKKISKDINKNSGLWIINGIKGTGKTSSLKIIANNNPDKKFIYIPNIFIESTINSTEIFDFIKNNASCIFIIDDIENLFNNFEVKGNHLIQNISQLIDNFLFKDGIISFIIISNEEDSEYLEYLENINSFKYKMTISELDSYNISKIKEIRNIKYVYDSNKKNTLNEILINKKSTVKKHTGF